MTLTIKARELGDEHLGAKIRTTMAGWTIEGYLEEVRGNSSDYYLGLREKFSRGTAAILRDADVTILEEAPIRHPDEPTGLGAVVEEGGSLWIRTDKTSLPWREVKSGAWRAWEDFVSGATAPIRVLSEGVRLDIGVEPDLPEVYEGMGILKWPKDDEHLREWVIVDQMGDEWRWGTGGRYWPDGCWRWGLLSYSKPGYGPWTVLRKREDKEAEQ